MARNVSQEEYVVDFCVGQLQHRASDFLGWPPDEQISYLKPIAEGLIATPISTNDAATLRDKVAAKLATPQADKPSKKPKAKQDATGEAEKTYMVIDGSWKELLKTSGDRRFAEKLFNDLKKELGIEGAADEEQLRDLVLLKVRLRRSLVALNKKGVKQSEIGSISEALDKLLRRSGEMEKAMAATREQRTKRRDAEQSDDVFQTVKDAKACALRYMEEHPNTFMQWACANCGTIHFSGLPHPFFEGCYLWNEPLARLVKAGRIAIEEAAEVLGWSPVEGVSRMSAQGYADLLRRRGHHIAVAKGTDDGEGAG